MKRKTLLIALGLSLLFNVFVLIGFMQARSQPQPPPPDDQGMIRQMTRDLRLTDQQVKMLSSLREDQRRQGAVFDDSVALVRQSLLAEIRKPSPDVDRLRALVDQEAELFRQRRLAGAELFERFVDQLTPQQRQALSGRFGRSPRGPEPLRNRFERFDVNHNGRLDPDEMRQAHQEMERRRRDFFKRPPAPPPWKQLDDNGDLPQGGPANPPPGNRR